jgi:hypothetical protein
METSATTDGLSAILGPVVLEVDKAILATQNSQDDLGKEIERLVAGKKKGRKLNMKKGHLTFLSF